MPKTALRTVDGAIVVVIPSAYIEHTGLGPGSEVQWEINGDRLIVRPDTGNPQPYYTLDELLAECDPTAEPPDPDPEWTAGGPKGRELV